MIILLYFFNHLLFNGAHEHEFVSKNFDLSAVEKRIEELKKGVMTVYDKKIDDQYRLKETVEVRVKMPYLPKPIFSDALKFLKNTGFNFNREGKYWSQQLSRDRFEIIKIDFVDYNIRNSVDLKISL